MIAFGGACYQSRIDGLMVQWQQHVTNPVQPQVFWVIFEYYPQGEEEQPLTFLKNTE